MLILHRDGTTIADPESSWDLSERDLRDANFRGIVLEGGNFSDSDIRANDFSGSDLYDSYLYRANCAGCNFKQALLRGVVLDEAILVGASFEGAKLIPNNMGTACSLLGADLRNANLEGTILTKCEFNSTTLFPEGFDPIAKGMVNIT